MITLSPSEQRFIQAHLADDVQSLLLRAHPARREFDRTGEPRRGNAELAGVDIKKLAAQISARQKAREKLPIWYANAQLVFPPALSVEQASSEQTARYKASLVAGRLLLDLTGGMGVDTWAFAHRIEQVVYLDRQPDLATLAAHNLPLLGLENVQVYVGDGVGLLESANALAARSPLPNTPADWIYLDPHRRNDQGGRVVRLTDCEPDISNPDLLRTLLQRAPKILVKVSPLLDLDLSVRQLSEAIEAVHIVAVQNEVKEILFIIGNQRVAKEDIAVNSVNLLPDGPITMRFRWQDERNADVTYAAVQDYIYEPNAAVLKAGAFRLTAARFGLDKLAPNSHLYTSNDLKINFPGRIFKVQEVIKPDAKALKLVLPELKANLTVRNFPQTVAELRKKLSLREGGSVYILATTLYTGDKRLLITKKVE
ncbi:THUMP-like domain-containing protein [Spirosoma areae]